MRFIFILCILLPWLQISEANTRKKPQQQENHTLLNVSLGVIAAGLAGMGGYWFYQRIKKNESPTESSALEHRPEHQPCPTNPLLRESEKRKKHLFDTEQEVNRINQQLKLDKDKKHLTLNGHIVDDLVDNQMLDSVNAGAYLKAAKDQEKLDIYIPDEEINPASVVFSHFESEIANQNGTMGRLQDVVKADAITFEDRLPKLFKDFRRSEHEYMIVPTVQDGHYNTTVFKKTDDPEKFKAVNIDPLNNHRNTVIEHAIEAMDPNKKIDYQHISAGVQRDGTNCGPLSLSLAVDLVKDNQNKPSDDWKQGMQRITKAPDYYPEGGHLAARLKLLKAFANTRPIVFTNE